MFHPIVRRKVNNWEDLETIWRHAFENELRVAPEERKILLTESTAWGDADRERALQMQFETFGVAAAHLSLEAVLAMHAAGRQNGVVVDSGMATCAVPVVGGRALRHAIKSTDLGGAELTDWIALEMAQNGYSDAANKDCWRGICRDMKEKMTAVALDFDAAVRSHDESGLRRSAYELPNGMCV